jgi:serine/threonine-protein kinase
MRICPQCQTRFTEPVSFCPHDGSPTEEAAPEEIAAVVDPLLGRVIDGRYRVEKMIGEGGMGVVYLITHAVLGKRMALKVLRGDMARDSDVVQRFMQEAQSATSIGHQNIIDISDFGRLPDGSVYFVMEYLDGQSLSKMISRGGSIPTVTAVHVVRQIASALDGAHQRGIVHRDLKPDNIYLIKQGNDTNFVKVLDFGIAKVGGASSKLTKTGMIFGTPHYMSPEQAAGQSVDQRTDIYALGVIMYEMFTGRVPFDGDTFMGILSKHMFEEPKPPSEIAGTTGLGAIEDIILHALEKKPEQRYNGMTDLIADLDKVASGGVVQIGRAGVMPPNNLADMLEPPSKTEMRIGQSLPTPEPSMAPPTSKLPLVLGALALLAVLGLAAGGAAFAFSGDMPMPGMPTTPVAVTPPVVVPPVTVPPVTVPPVTVPPVTVPPVTIPSVPGVAGAGTPGEAPVPPVAPLPAVAAVEIASEPAGAEVLIDGAVLGTTPLRIPRPSSGERTVVVRLRGYDESRLMVSAVSSERMDITLARTSSSSHRRPPETGTVVTPPTTPTTTPPETPPTGGRTTGPARTSEVVDPWAN